MSVTPEQAKDIGRRGGTVPTNGMPYPQKERTDKAVNDGKQGK